MKLLDVAQKIASFLEEHRVPYAIIGGMALQYWGEPRLTRDIDVTVLIPQEALEDFIYRALSHFKPRFPDAIEFALKHRILLVESEGVPVDISLGIPGYEEEALKRAVKVSFPGGLELRLLAAEDLIIHKCVAGRPRDMEDVFGIFVRQGLKVDVDYIRRWLEAFRELVETHDPLQLFEESFHKASVSLKERDNST